MQKSPNDFELPEVKDKRWAGFCCQKLLHIFEYLSKSDFPLPQEINEGCVWQVPGHKYSQS